MLVVGCRFEINYSWTFSRCGPNVSVCFNWLVTIFGPARAEGWGRHTEARLKWFKCPDHGIMGTGIPDGGLLRYRKWVPQQLGDVNIQWSGDSRPMGARHGDTAANHTDLQSGCGRTCVFAVRVWSNLWELIWLRTSHYSMAGGLVLFNFDINVKLFSFHLKFGLANSETIFKKVGP